MESALILIVILIGFVLVVPIILSIGTRSKIKDLAEQMRLIENKLDLLLRNNLNVKESTTKQEVIKEAIPSYKATNELTPPIPKFSIPIETPIAPIKVLNEKELIPEPLERIPEPIPQKETEPYIYTESFWEKFNRKNPDLEKFVGENLINKIGIAILVLGIAFFVKYAIDKEWINEYARVGVGVLAGCIVLLFAHRLHTKFKAFSSVLVAGAIAIFYFTITIGFQEYQIFSQTAAFAIMIGITLFSVAISLLYDREELALLSLIGGFAAPFMVSTGSGNYKVLFTYILMLDLGMFILSVTRQWRRVHLLSYLFTLLLYGGWFFSEVVRNSSPPYAGAFLFAALFFITFFMMGLLRSIKSKKAIAPFDLSLILLINFLFAGVGLYILSNYQTDLKGAFIIALAVLNFIIAFLLHKQYNAEKNLVYLLIGITLSYATLAAPIQLNGNYITLFWAAEAVLLLWLAQRSEIKIYRVASMLVNLLMVISLVMDWKFIYQINSTNIIPIIINKGFITSFVSFSSILALLYLSKEEKFEYSFLDFIFSTKTYSELLVIMAMLVAYLGGIIELSTQLNAHYGTDEIIKAGLFCYHLLFSAAIIRFFIIKENESSYFFPTLLGVTNLLLYLFAVNNLSFESIKNSILYNSDGNTVFILHYFSLAAFSYGCYLIIRFFISNERFDQGTKNNSYRMLAFLVIFLSSSELLLHILKFSGFQKQIMIDNVLAPTLEYYYILREQIIKVGFPILWGLIAFVFIAIGMQKQVKALRVIALVLLAVTLIKLAFYDIRNASEAGKIIAFILLGIVLLVMSFMYQKIKAIILDDEK